MRFDFSGADLFLSYLAGGATIHRVLRHPAYQAVCHHARLYTDGVSEQDLLDAVDQKKSPFYGLEDWARRLPHVRSLLETVRSQQDEWLPLASSQLARLLPDADLHITVYPIIGYDMGIGLDGCVCMNLNCPQYLAEPREFLFFIIHECVHVLYERCHRVPALDEVNGPAEWRSFFNLWVQNEGFAVYAPLKLRQEMGCLDERDYRVLFDSGAMDSVRRSFMEAERLLNGEAPLTREQYIECCFGDQRLSYRMGCDLLRRIEREHGMEAVRRAFYLDADPFMGEYRHLRD